MTFKKIFLTIFILSSFAFSPFAYSQSKAPEPIPTKAPFSTDGNTTVNSGSSLMNIYDDEAAAEKAPLDTPHRTTEQVSNWVEDHLTNAMNIDVTTWDDHLKKITPDFDPYGLQEYQAYLASSGILNLLKTNNLKINAISDSNPVLLSEGAISGTYHWLYQMPLMLSYYDQEATSLKNGQTKAQNQKVTIRVQVGRVAKGADDNNIVIERWSAIATPADQ